MKIALAIAVLSLLCAVLAGCNKEPQTQMIPEAEGSGRKLSIRSQDTGSSPTVTQDINTTNPLR